MAKKPKYKYYLATVCENGRLQYVTGIQNTGHWFFRDAGKPAMEFTKSMAEEIFFGMVLNMHDAVIVQQFAFMQAPCNPPEDYKEGEPYKTRTWGEEK